MPLKMFRPKQSSFCSARRVIFSPIKVVIGVAAFLAVSGTSGKAAECFQVSANQGWQPYQLRGSYPGRMSIQFSGEWSVNPEKYAYVSPLSGHFDRELEQKYPHYKYDRRYPFGILLFSSDGNSSERVAPFTYLPRQGWLRINDSDRTSGNNQGIVNVCVYPG
jgi:hypothetical protein